MMLFLRLFKHLLPDAKAWRITIDKRLRQFFSGLTVIGKDVKIFFDQIFTDIDPQQTRQLDLWENQFALPDTGLSEQERRDRLDATWKAVGGQSPRYIQDTVQAAGFVNVFIHEWWIPGSEADVNVKACATPRDPFDVLEAAAGIIIYLTECGEPNAECGEAFMEAGNFVQPKGSLLVNKVFQTFRDYLTLCGEPFMECGEVAAECGDFISYINIPRNYPIPTDPAKWPYILYFCGQTYGTTAIVDANRQDEFEDLLLKICPAQQWLGVIIDYIAATKITANQIEDGDTQAAVVLTSITTKDYGWTIAALGGGAYGMGSITPNDIFWLQPDVPIISSLSVSSTDIIQLSSSPNTFDQRQSRIYVTVPGFSATPIQMDLGGAPYIQWVVSSSPGVPPAGLNAYLATQVGNTIPVTIDVLGDITTLEDNEHFFRADQITGSNIRGFDSAAAQGTGEFGPGYIARMECFDDPTRLITNCRVTTAGLFVINLSDESGFTPSVSTMTFAIEGWNGGAPITLTWSGVDFRASSPATDGLSAYFISIFGQTKKITITGPVP